jgi:hypothetical protein
MVVVLCCGRDEVLRLRDHDAQRFADALWDLSPQPGAASAAAGIMRELRRAREFRRGVVLESHERSLVRRMVGEV